MDYYHKKYLKYKFKYLNLLNQSGGALKLESMNDNDFKKKLVENDSTNKSLTIYEIEQLLNKSLTDDIIIEILQKKLTFAPDIIQILKKNIQIKELGAINEYNRICMEAVKKNGLALQLLNMENVTPFFLQEQSEEQLKDQFSWQLRLQDSVVKLIQVCYDHQFKYLQICIEAVKQNAEALEYVHNFKHVDNNFKQKTQDFINFIKSLETKYTNEYLINKLKQQITFEHGSLRTVKDLLEIEKYYEICMKAVNQDPLLLENVMETNNLEEMQYFKIYMEAVKKNGLALQYIHKNTNNFKEDNLRKIILEAVKQNGLALQYIYKNNIYYLAKLYDIYNENNYNASYYAFICINAFMQHEDALKFVEIKNLKENEYEVIIIFALKKKNNCSILINALIYLNQQKNEITDDIFNKFNIVIEKQHRKQLQLQEQQLQEQQQ